jgi:hypothetical protein
MNNRKKKDKILINSIYNNIKNNHIELFKTYQFQTKNQKYKLKEILGGCIFFIKISSSWNNFYYNNINPYTIRKNFIKLSKFNIFEHTYIDVIKRYLKKYNKRKMMSVYTDSSFFCNKYNTDMAERNYHYYNKKGIKLSIITDSQGFPFSIKLFSGKDNLSRQILLK